MIVCPGQGSQTPGFLSPWLELPGASDRLADWSASSGLDLERLGTTATLQEITDTAVTQPLVVASALLGAAELRRRGQVPSDTLVAGHSIGEIAALAIAGVVWFVIYIFTAMYTPGFFGIKLFGNDLEQLDALATEIEAVVREVPGTTSAFAERLTGAYYLDITPDLPSLAQYGVTLGEVQDVVLPGSPHLS